MGKFFHFPTGKKKQVTSSCSSIIINNMASPCLRGCQVWLSDQDQGHHVSGQPAGLIYFWYFSAGFIHFLHKKSPLLLRLIIKPKNEFSLKSISCISVLSRVSLICCEKIASLLWWLLIKLKQVSMQIDILHWRFTSADIHFLDKKSALFYGD